MRILQKALSSLQPVFQAVFRPAYRYIAVAVVILTLGFFISAAAPISFAQNPPPATDDPYAGVCGYIEEIPAHEDWFGEGFRCVVGGTVRPFTNFQRCSDDDHDPRYACCSLGSQCPIRPDPPVEIEPPPAQVQQPNCGQLRFGTCTIGNEYYNNRNDFVACEYVPDQCCYEESQCDQPPVVTSCGAWRDGRCWVNGRAMEGGFESCGDASGACCAEQSQCPANNGCGAFVGGSCLIDGEFYSGFSNCQLNGFPTGGCCLNNNRCLDSATCGQIFSTRSSQCGCIDPTAGGAGPNIAVDPVGGVYSCCGWFENGHCYATPPVEFSCGSREQNGIQFDPSNRSHLCTGTDSRGNQCPVSGNCCGYVDPSNNLGCLSSPPLLNCPATINTSAAAGDSVPQCRCDDGRPKFMSLHPDSRQGTYCCGWVIGIPPNLTCVGTRPVTAQCGALYTPATQSCGCGNNPPAPNVRANGRACCGWDSNLDPNDQCVAEEPIMTCGTSVTLSVENNSSQLPPPSCACSSLKRMSSLPMSQSEQFCCGHLAGFGPVYQCVNRETQPIACGNRFNPGSAYCGCIGSPENNTNFFTRSACCGWLGDRQSDGRFECLAQDPEPTTLSCGETASAARIENDGMSCTCQGTQLTSLERQNEDGSTEMCCGWKTGYAGQYTCGTSFKDEKLCSENFNPETAWCSCAGSPSNPVQPNAIGPATACCGWLDGEGTCHESLAASLEVTMACGTTLTRNIRHVSQPLSCDCGTPQIMSSTNNQVRYCCGSLTGFPGSYECMRESSERVECSETFNPTVDRCECAGAPANTPGSDGIACCGWQTDPDDPTACSPTQPPPPEPEPPREPRQLECGTTTSSVQDTCECGALQPLPADPSTFCCGSIQAGRCIDPENPPDGGGGGGDPTDPRNPAERTPTLDIFAGPTAADFAALNPLRLFGSPFAQQFSSPAGIVNRALLFAFPLGGLILFVMLIWAGFEMVIKAAGSKSLEAGRQRATAALIGFGLLFGSFWIIQIIEYVFKIAIL